MLKMSFSRIIGRETYHFQVEGANAFECFHNARVIGFPHIFECGICKSKNIHPRAYVTENGGFEYLKVVCSDCKASITFGRSKKDKNTMYLRRNEDGSFAWEKYEEKTEEPF